MTAQLLRQRIPNKIKPLNIHTSWLQQQILKACRSLHACSHNVTVMVMGIL